ncbi:MAG: methyl-accepting chemotaxis protein [Spirochaetaceae bacterium]|jgi:methyl-accepting chemotaxis protein|nr:methyl-accepting chemotaxis protein [Spirochaetaceae bacterium]
MKIGKKLVVMIIILNLAGTAALTGALLSIARKQIHTLIKSEITNLAKENALEIQRRLELYLDAARSAGLFMSRYEKIARHDRRPLFNLLIRITVEENPDIIAAGSVWEPDALDGLDAQFADTAGTDHSGRFIPYWARTDKGLSLQPVVGYETPGGGEYYLLPKRTGKETLMDPYSYEIDGSHILMTTVTMPIKNNGRFVGAMSMDIDVGTIQQIVGQIRPYEGSVAIVYSHGGLVSGHFDPARNGRPMMETEGDVAGAYLENLRKAIEEGREFSFINNVPRLGGDMVFVNVPITVGKTGTPWALMLGIPKGVITAPIYRMLWIGVVIAALMLLVVSAGALFLSRSISRPLKRMVLVLNDIGEGDLTKRLESTAKDEIGDMTRSFNTTLEKIRGLILMIREKAHFLSQTGTDLSINMNTTAAAVSEITAHIRNLKTQVSNQNAEVDEAGRTMEKISASIADLNDQIDKQAEGVAQSSSAIEQMLANIQSVTNTLIKNTDNVRDLAEASGIGRTGLQNVAADIQGIARESEGLLEINAVMENIASQTNLLSMNAAIEAAHAGEAGKGFAVVADEIRKLAESSGEQSKTISAVLKKIKDSIDKITRSTNEVLNKFEAIDTGVKTVSDQEENIRNAMEEQGQGSKQILDAISQLNEITLGVKGSSTEMNMGSKEVIATSRTLEAITQEITTGMNEMAVGADQINIAVDQVNKISNRNKSDINELIQEVNKFKIA